MLDEEVNFDLRRSPPKSPVLSRLENILWTIGTVGGALGGFFFAKKAMDFGNAGSTVLGVPSGAVVGGYLVHQVTSALNQWRGEQYQNLERRLDSEAKSSDATVFTFRYRGNPVECVIREEFENQGHIFYIDTNDLRLSSATFSYQPSSDEPLKFRYVTSRFKEAFEEKTTNQLLQDATNQRFLEVIGHSSQGTQKDSSASGRASLAAYQRDLHAYLQSEGREFGVEFQRDREGQLFTILKYKGENYESESMKFSRVASHMMEILDNHRG